MKLRVFGAIGACVFAFGLVSTAHSGQITQLMIQDVGSTVGGTYNPVPDGNSGGGLVSCPSTPRHTSV